MDTKLEKLTKKQIIGYFRERLEVVRKQRNQYEQQVLRLEKELDLYHPKTPSALSYNGHYFVRYLIDNLYAEEMKCSCGLIIPACYNTRDIENALKDLDLLTHPHK